MLTQGLQYSLVHVPYAVMPPAAGTQSLRFAMVASALDQLDFHSLSHINTAAMRHVTVISKSVTLLESVPTLQGLLIKRAHLLECTQGHFRLQLHMLRFCSEQMTLH